MGEFEVTTPGGWTVLTAEQASKFIADHSEESILDMLRSNQLAAVEARLQDSGLVAGNATVIDFRMFRDGDVVMIWYKLSQGGT